MADFSQFGGPDDENAEIKKLALDVEGDSDNFEAWEKLIRACEAQEGGLNRNSSPQALAQLRDAYDRFLIKFPLLFGYWKKYADLEFNISGPESAEMIYERGCASITNCVDLWTSYCSFKMETTHTPHLVRESFDGAQLCRNYMSYLTPIIAKGGVKLSPSAVASLIWTRNIAHTSFPCLLFERAAVCVGLDFLAHPFWDKYLEYEERQEASDKIFDILQRVIRIPMHQYARYYERFRQLIHTHPVAETCSADTLARLQAEVNNEAAAYGAAARSEAEVERDLRNKIDALYYETFQQTQEETQKRWTYESELKRPYFHVTELENAQLVSWRRYLDFEEAAGDFARTVFLYERCIVTCALYDEFWFRYAKWMSAQDGKEEEVRHIYMRAATIFVPISRPGIRLQFAYFEESCGRVDVARDIHEAILMRLPDCVEAIISWANLQRRQSGLDAAIEVLKAHIDTQHVDLFTKAVLVSHWAFLLWRTKGSSDEARTVFTKNVQWYADSGHFWQKWIDFELQQPAVAEDGDKQFERVKHVFDELVSKSRISSAAKQDLCLSYLAYLQDRGGKDAMKQFLTIDKEIYGPSSLCTLEKFAPKENGALKAPLDEATRLKAESRYPSYYEYYGEAQASGQGNAPFA